MSVAESEVDAAVWRAVAGISVHIPPPNSYTYYFPKGHLEQESPESDDRITGELPIFLCRVLAVKFLVDPVTEELSARFALLPVQNNRNAAPSDNTQNGVDVYSDDLAVNSDIARQRDDVISFSKTLTPSDANNGGGFSVPRFCADLIFPKLDLTADPPVQNLSILDLNSREWVFRHIYRGTPRRHLLTTGWSKFVNTKLLMSGDSVVFMRKKSTGELFAGVRRCGAAGRTSPESSGGDVFLNDFNALLERAERGEIFEVVYKPRGGGGAGISPSFVVAAERVEAAVARMFWRPGMRVRMEMESNDSSRMMGVEGSVVAVNRGSSPWKMLQITWDEPLNQNFSVRVNPWEVECVLDATTLQAFPYPPLMPLPKRFRLTPPSIDAEEQGYHFPATQFGGSSPNLFYGHAGPPSLMEPLGSPVEQEPSTTVVSAELDQTLRLGSISSDQTGGNGGSRTSFRLFGAEIDIGEGDDDDYQRRMALNERLNANNSISEV